MRIDPISARHVAAILFLIAVLALGYFIGRLLQGKTVRGKILGVIVFAFTLYLFGAISEWLINGGLR